MTTYSGVNNGTSGNDIVFGAANDFGPNPSPFLIGALDNTIPTLHGFAGNDIIFGDLFTANANTDTEPQSLYGDDGNDWLFGDTVDFSYAPLLALFPSLQHIVFTLADGTAVDITGDADFLTKAYGKSDDLHGGNHDDHLFGGGSFDSLFGDAGNDVLDGGIGDDYMEGGIGNDTYYVDNVFDTVSEIDGGGTDTVCTSVSYSLDGGSGVRSTIENMIAKGTSAISLTGNGLGNALYGSTNASGNTLTGLGGNDAYIVGAGDRVVEAAGAGGGVDTVYSSTFNLHLGSFANVENAVLQGASSFAVTGSAVANALYGNTGSDLRQSAQCSRRFFAPARFQNHRPAPLALFRLRLG